MAASNRHRKGIGRKRYGKQQRAHSIEARPISHRFSAIDGQGATGENEIQDTKWHVDEEDHPPSESADQNTAEGRAESGADRGHRSEQTHGTTGL